MNQHFPIVGIAASGTGLGDLFNLITDITANPGIAIVVVSHLPRDVESKLSLLVGKYTKMQVHRIDQDMPILVNHVYVVKEDIEITIADDCIKVSPRSTTERINRVIDIFLQSLGQGYGRRAIAIILGGMGNDGLQGVQQIEANGGYVIAMEPDSTRHSQMTTNVIVNDRPNVVAGVDEIAWLLAQRTNEISPPISSPK